MHHSAVMDVKCLGSLWSGAAHCLQLFPPSSASFEWKRLSNHTKFSGGPSLLKKLCQCPPWTALNIPSPSISGEQRLLTLFWTSRPASIPCPACRENSFHLPRKHYGEIAVLPSKRQEPYISELQSFFVHFTCHSYASVDLPQFSFSSFLQKQSQTI